MQRTIETSTLTLKVVTRGYGKNRCVRILHGNTVLQQIPIPIHETNEEAFKRVSQKLSEYMEFKGIVDTNAVYDDTMTALLLDETESNI